MGIKYTVARQLWIYVWVLMALTQRTSSISYEAGYASSKFSTYEKKKKNQNHISLQMQQH